MALLCFDRKLKFKFHILYHLIKKALLKISIRDQFDFFQHHSKVGFAHLLGVWFSFWFFILLTTGRPRRTVKTIGTFDFAQGPVLFPSLRHSVSPSSPRPIFTFSHFPIFTFT